MSRHMLGGTKRVVGVLRDLFFTVKIQEAAKRVGLEAVFVRSQLEALAQAREIPAMMIFDLNDAEIQPLELIEKLKNNEQTSQISLLGFVSHVQADLKHAAQERGCDVVVARSAFSQNLAAILSRYAV